MSLPEPEEAPYLGPSDPPPVRIHGENRRSRFLVVCDHAGNSVPQYLNFLGLTLGQLASHIAWDPNGWKLAIALADRLDATAIGQSYSRLVIDCNRRTTAPDSIAAISDGVLIPGNANISDGERQRRLHEIMTPYQNRIARACQSLANEGPMCIVAVHTFTPRLVDGDHRPWQIGVISGTDDRMRSRVCRRLTAGRRDLLIGENVPYTVSVENDYTLPVHAEAAGIPYVEFELRNDEFGDDASRDVVSRFIAEAVKSAFDDLCALPSQEVAP